MYTKLSMKGTLLQTSSSKNYIIHITEGVITPINAHFIYNVVPVTSRPALSFSDNGIEYYKRLSLHGL